MAKVFLRDGKLLVVGDWTDPEPPAEDVVEADLELTTTATGSIVLASDYKALRYAEYPPIRDQLDALWKGGEAVASMSALVQAVKDKYPKP